MLNPITIALQEGTVQVSVLWQQGVWAVHRAHEDSEASARAHRYVVTHVPSGRALRDGLTQRQAIGLGKVLYREAPDWGEASPFRACVYAPMPLQLRLRQLATPK